MLTFIRRWLYDHSSQINFDAYSKVLDDLAEDTRQCGHEIKIGRNGNGNGANGHADHFETDKGSA